MIKRAVALTLCCTFLLSACYSYQPVEPGDLHPDMEVRARITGVQADELGDGILTDDRTLEGTVVEAGSDDLLMDVPTGTLERRGRVETLSQRVRLQTSEIVALDQRRQDRAKTTALVAAGVGVAAVAVILGLNATSSNTNPGPGGGGPQDARIPLFRIPLGR